MSRPPSFSDLIGNLEYTNPDDTLAPSPSPSFLTLRRITKSPASTIRSGFRRSRTSVSSIASSSTASLPSLLGLSQQASRLSHDEPQQSQGNQQQPPTSCASRQQLDANDCALSRFIAWVAVRRNASRDISADEKCRCPLIKCRRLCPSPELMLQHLIACDELDDGLYYCHDCKRNEQFAETRCTRCIGHHSRRRKIAKMAMSLFSSLGQRPKTEDPPEPAMVVDPPESDMGVDNIGGPYEMENTSVHEIGTSDTLHPIPEDDKEYEIIFDPQYIRTEYDPSQPSTSVINSCGWDLQEDARGSYNLEGLTGGRSYPSVMDPIHEVTEPLPSGRPQLQLQTSGPGFTRLHSAKRRRVDALMHQSSTRSTASTNSTASNTSTVSSMSTASHAISPFSAVSEAWAHGYETDATTPADEGINLESLLTPAEHVSSSAHAVELEDCMKDVIPGPCELPADQPDTNEPALTPYPTDAHIFDAVPVPMPMPQLNQSSVDNVQFTNLHVMDCFIPEVNLPELEANPLALVTPASLVEKVKTVLEEHVQQSREKLRTRCGNHLADRFTPKTPSDIAHTGLRVLRDIMSDRRPADPVDLLCFIHLVYSISLAIREQDAPSQWAELYSEALSYSSSLSKQDHQAYVYIVGLLWKPDLMTTETLRETLRTTSLCPASPKGKAPQPHGGRVSSALVFVAQYFLDELDELAIHELSSQAVMASDLVTQHIHDINIQGNARLRFQSSVNHLLQVLMIRYSEPSFVQYLTGLSSRLETNLSTPRRLELDLLRAGRTRLAPALYFDEYIHLVRGYLDSLYEQHTQYPNSRPAYHLNGISLFQTLLTNIAPVAPKASDTPEEVGTESIDALMTKTTSIFGEGNSFPIASYASSSEVGLLAASGLPRSDAAARDRLNSPGLMSEMINTSGLSFLDQTPVTSRHTTATTSPTQTTPPMHETPPSATTTAPTPSSQPVKVVSDTKCDLCDYRPSGDPKWFHSSMSKHLRTKHCPEQKIFKCPFEGCKSQYTNREDNLKQHQAEKNHYVGDEEVLRKKSSKRKREKKGEENFEEE